MKGRKKGGRPAARGARTGRGRSARGRPGRPWIDPSGPVSQVKLLLSPADRRRLERLQRRLALPSLSAAHRAAVVAALEQKDPR